MSAEGFIGRWSRKKRAAAAPAKEGAASPGAATPSFAGAPPATVAGAAPPVPLSDPHALPPLESLTSHSDFSAFLRPDVEPATRAQALKTLFGDPALYPMDGLDVYIDDYSKPDPLPEGWLEKLNQFAALDAVPAAEEAARKKEEAARQAAAAAPAAPETSAKPAEQVAETPPGTGEPACASDPLAPGAPAAEEMYRDPI